MKANTFQIEVRPAVPVSQHSFAFLNTQYQQLYATQMVPQLTGLLLQVDVPTGTHVDEVMKRFKNESRRVNTVLEVRAHTQLPMYHPLALVSLDLAACIA